MSENKLSSAELQFLYESLLINQILPQSNNLVKQAEISDLLGGVAGYLKNWAKDNIDTTSVESTLSSLAKIMTPSILFKLHPLLGGVYLIANQFGFDLGDVISNIYHFIADKLTKNQSITPDDINQIGKKMVGGSAEASVNFAGELIKEAAGIPDIPLLFPKAGSSLLESVFGNLFQTGRTGKAKWLITGLVVWIIKTLLGGAGLLMLSDAAGSLFGHHRETVVEKNNPTALENSSTKSLNNNLFKPSGDGEQFHPNDANKIWVIPLIKNDLVETLYQWTLNIYSELAEKDKNIIIDSQKFQSMVSKLKPQTKNNNLIVPKNFHTRKEIVDQFITDLT